ncbi:MAG: hypothetical protein R3A44_02515 [Caldilineaceae bacterium]
MGQRCVGGQRRHDACRVLLGVPDIVADNVLVLDYGDPRRWIFCEPMPTSSAAKSW